MHALVSPATANVPAILWWLFLALIAGVLISSLLNQRFALAWRPQSVWHGYFWGGSMMGAGAALIPGGNDVILLNAIPGMSPHAVPAYAAMLVGVLIGLLFVKWRGGAWDVIDCSGDLCRTHQSTANS